MPFRPDSVSPDQERVTMASPASVFIPLSVTRQKALTNLACSRFIPELFFKRLRGTCVDDKIAALKELSLLNRTAIQSMSLDLKLKLFNQLTVLFHETVKNGRGPQTMTTLMTAMIKALECLYQADGYFKLKIDDGHLFLERLTTWIKWINPIEELYLETILKTIELLTKDCIIAFKPPFIAHLIEVVLGILNTKDHSDLNFIICMKILINLCDRNANCYLAVRADVQFKSVWKKLNTIAMQEKPDNFRSSFLIHHVLFILESGISSQLINWGVKYARPFTIKCLLECENKNEIQSAGTHLDEIIGFMKMLLYQLKLRIDLCSIEDGSEAELRVPDDLANEVTMCKEMVQQVAGSTLIHLWSTNKGKSEVKIIKDHWRSCVQLIVALTPKHLPLSEMIQPYKAAFALMKLFVPYDGIKKEFAAQDYHLEGLIHLVKKIINEADSPTRESFDSELRFALSCARLTETGSHPIKDKMCIASCRIFSLLRGIPSLAGDLELKLEEGSIRRLLQYYLAHSDSEYTEKSCCVIEILGVLADHSHVPALLEVLLDFIQEDTTASHIAKGIFSGDRKVAHRALKITGSVAFSRNSLNVVANALTKSALNGGGISLNAGENTSLSPYAARSMAKLDEALEPIMATYNNNDDENPVQHLLVQDVVALYELKGNVHEAENEGLRVQLRDMTKTSDKVKQLLTKQTEMFAEHLAGSEKKDRQIQILSHHLRITREELTSAKEVIKTELASTEQMLAHKSKKLEECEKQLKLEEIKNTGLCNDFRALKIEAEKTEGQRAKAQETATMLTEEKRSRDMEMKELKERLAKLEREVKHKEEERKKFEALLEKEKRTVDTIKGLLGNNL